MEVGALVLSIVSLIATVLIAIWQICITIKINKINLNSNICEKIFDKYLIVDIPFNRRKLKFDCNEVLTGWDSFNKILVDMKRDSLYFKYNDEFFYNKLTNCLTELEDYITSQINKRIDSTEHSKIFDEIEVDKQIQMIVRGLGGRDNFSDLDCCITRLRAAIVNTDLVSESLLKQAGAAAIVLQGNNIQII